jgi:PAS domain S-box-containing protein
VNQLLLNAGLDVLSWGILIIDKEKRVVFCNKTAREILGVQPQDIIDKNFQEFFQDDHVEHVLKSGEPILGIRFSREERKYELRYEPVFCHGKISGVTVAIQDMSEWDKLVLELENKRRICQEMEDIFDSSYDEIFVTDGEGYTIRVSRACERLYGVNAMELIGKSVNDLEQQGFFSPNVTSQALREKRRVTSLQRTKGGQELIVTSNPVFDNQGNIILVVTNSRDVTELSNLKKRLEETEKLVDSYRSKIAQLNKERLVNGEDLIYASPAMKSIINMIDKVAAVDSTVLIEGESGVGKGVIAARIHRLSKRAGGPFITINCGAIPDSLIESELFGYEAGAFTGAKRDGKKGLIEMANGGTVFFDEIGELPINLQVKLLHVIQEKRMKRVGGREDVQADIRIIAATNKNLKKLVTELKFREDLYYRLNVIPVVIPPLRQRKEDIRELINKFLAKFNERYELNKRFSPEALRILDTYHWPGNVREVENLIERLLVTVDGAEILPSHLPEYLKSEGPHGSKVVVLDLCGLKTATEEVEKQLLKKAMGQFSNTYKIAQALDVNQSTVVRKLHRYGLVKESEIMTGKE